MVFVDENGWMGLRSLETTMSICESRGSMQHRLCSLDRDSLDLWRC